MRANTLQVRISDTLKDKIVAFAAEHDMNTSEAARNLLSIGLSERVVEANRFTRILKALGYERIADIPEDKVDDVVGAYLSARQGN